MKKRQNTATSRCPYCGMTYRHAGMAERCLKGPLCRVYNSVTGERRAVFDIQCKAAACVQFAAAPLESSEYDDVGAHAKRCISLCEELYGDMKALRCGVAVFNAATTPTVRLLEFIWPPVKTDITHLLATAQGVPGIVARAA